MKFPYQERTFIVIYFKLILNMKLLTISQSQKISARPIGLPSEIATHPNHSQTKRLQRLLALNKDIEARLIPWQTRTDWVDPFQYPEYLY